MTPAAVTQIPPSKVESKKGSAEAVNQLASAAESLGMNPEDLYRQATVRALRKLAGELDLLSIPNASAAEKLRSAAQRFELSLLAAPADAAIVKEGLSATLKDLATMAIAPKRSIDYQRMIRLLEKAVSDLNSDRPLLDQRIALATAFRAATDVISLANGVAPPFGEAGFGSEGRQSAISFRTALDEARNDVLKLAQSNVPDRRIVSHTLSSLADAISAMDKNGNRDVEKQVSTIRLQVDRLRLSDPLSFGQAEWVKIGLSSVLTALETLPFGQERNRLPWNQTAIQAIDGIKEHMPLSLQGVIIQDAFRTTVDALLAASQPVRLGDQNSSFHQTKGGRRASMIDP